MGAARNFWQQCVQLLPADTVQYKSIQARISDLDAALSQAKPPGNAKWGKRAAGLGPVLVLALTKGKLLLLGLTKIGTVLSMLAFVGVYWALFGWWFALGSVLSIYVHEMGHVIKLRYYGIAASAPMFIPGLGAIIRLRQLHITPIQDARVGLAGPIYGLGAAVVMLGASYLTGSKACASIAHFGGVINLFNLIPVWQLDGSRGFRSLDRNQRIIVAALAAVLWFVTKESMLILVALVAVYRLFTKDSAPEPDQTGLLQFAGLLVALSVVIVLARMAAAI